MQNETRLQYGCAIAREVLRQIGRLLRRCRRLVLTLGWVLRCCLFLVILSLPSIGISLLVAPHWGTEIGYLAAYVALLLNLALFMMVRRAKEKVDQERRRQRRLGT